jgi:hypothetical protein
MGEAGQQAAAAAADPEQGVCAPAVKDVGSDEQLNGHGHDIQITATAAAGAGSHTIVHDSQQQAWTPRSLFAKLGRYALEQW